MKSTSLNPLLIPQPFATGNGATLTPIERSSGTMPNFEDGIPANFSAPKSGGGSYFQRGMMNAIGHMASANSFFHQCGGYHSFDQNVCDAIGGYPNGCVLHWLTNGKFIAVESLVDDNTFDFTRNGIDGIHWREVSSIGINFPTFDQSKKQMLWSNSAMSITNQFTEISAQVTMPFDGYVNYLSTVKASVGGVEQAFLSGYQVAAKIMTRKTIKYVPLEVYSQVGFIAYMGITSPDDSGMAPDVDVNLADPVSGERNCALFMVDGLGDIAAGAGAGLIPVRKGSKIKLFGQETYSKTIEVNTPVEVATEAGTVTSTETTSVHGSFSGWLSVEAYPIFTAS